MSRVQLALNVSDLDAGRRLLLEALRQPRRPRCGPGYANFAIADPPLKLVLIENADGRGSGVAGALNHLGVEVDDRRRGGRRPAAASSGEGLDTADQEADDLLLRRPGQGVGRRTPTARPGRSTPCSPTPPVEAGRRAATARAARTAEAGASAGAVAAACC